MAKKRNPPQPRGRGGTGPAGSISRALIGRVTQPAARTPDPSAGLPGGILATILVDRRLRVVRADLPPSLGWVDARQGRPVTDLLPAADREAVAARLQRVLDTAEPLVARLQRLPRTGTQPIVVSLTALPAERGLVVTLIDMTSKLELYAASGAIGSSLDIPTLARQVAEALLPWGTATAVSLSVGVLTGNAPFDDDLRLRRVALAPVARIWPAGFPALGARHRCPYPVDDVVLLPDRDAVERALEAHPDVAVPDDGPIALVHLPLAVPDEEGRPVVLGTVEVWRRLDERPPFDQDDLAALGEVTAHATAHLDVARRHLAEHEQVVALQRGILPTLAETPYVHTAGAYLPTTADAAGVGGDWYDVIRLSGGRIALVVGDVVGHGIAAAATMGRLRSAVQTLAYADASPARLISRLDDLVLRLDETEPDLGASALGSTLCYLEHDPIEGTCTLASAGHLPPALVHPDGRTEWITVADPHPPLGSAAQDPPRTTTIAVPPGALLALYTDGLVEPPGGGVDDGLDALAAELAAIRPEDDLQEAADGIARRLVPARRRDDVTLLLARPLALPDDVVTTLRLGAGDPAAASAARAATARAVAPWTTAARTADAVLVVSELVTNAVRHGAGDPVLRLVRDGTRLVVEVADGSAVEPELLAPAEEAGAGRGLGVVAYLAAHWGTRPRPAGVPGKVVWADVPL